MSETVRVGELFYLLHYIKVMDETSSWQVVRIPWPLCWHFTQFHIDVLVC